MKKCYKCGAQQSDSRIFCIDCDERLGSSLSASENKAFEAETKNKIEKMYKTTDPLSVSVLDRILGFSSLFGIGLIIIFMIIFRKNVDRVPETLYTIILFLFCALNALIPKILWAIEKIRLSFTIDGSEDAEPSGFYLMMRRLSIIICFVLAVILLIISIYCLINPPELPEYPFDI